MSAAPLPAKPRALQGWTSQTFKSLTRQNRSKPRGQKSNLEEPDFAGSRQLKKTLINKPRKVREDFVIVKLE